MNKSLAFLGTAFVIFSFCQNAGAQSASQTACLQAVAQNEQWRDFTPGTMGCLLSDSFSKLDYAESMAYLCSKDQKTLSANYQLYLAYEHKYNEASERFRKATDLESRTTASLDAEWAQQDWTLVGKRAEVSDYLNRIDQAEFHCEGK